MSAIVAFVVLTAFFTLFVVFALVFSRGTSSSWDEDTLGAGRPSTFDGLRWRNAWSRSHRHHGHGSHGGHSSGAGGHKPSSFGSHKSSHKPSSHKPSFSSHKPSGGGAKKKW